jgi:hypothetical protein
MPLVSGIAVQLSSQLKEVSRLVARNALLKAVFAERLRPGQ